MRRIGQTRNAPARNDVAVHSPPPLPQLVTALRREDSMGFFDDIWEKVKKGATDAASVLWERAKEEMKDAARHAWERRTATVPPDVQRILDATPETETPMLPIRADTLVFLDRDFLERYE